MPRLGHRGRYLARPTICTRREQPCRSMLDDPDVARQLDAFYVAHKLEGQAHRTVIDYLLIEPPRPAVEGARRSRGWAKLTRGMRLPISEYEAAISDMMDRDLAWEIDADKLSLIADFVDATPALGPTDGMPELGTLQISIHFANLLDQLWTNIEGERPSVYWARDWKSDKRHLIYSPTHTGCFDFLRDELVEDDEYPNDIEQLFGPQPCGPWRCQWWRKYESGYVLEVRYV